MKLVITRMKRERGTYHLYLKKIDKIINDMRILQLHI